MTLMHVEVTTSTVEKQEALHMPSVFLFLH